MEHSPLRSIVDAGAVALVAGSMVKALPAIGAFLAIWWYGIQIWQSETGLHWRARWRRLILRQALSVEDKVMFLVLGLAGAGVLLAMEAVQVLTQ